MTDSDITAIRDALAAVNAPKCGPLAVDIYKATCNPERIARLLDALEAATRDAERYRALKARAHKKTAYDIYGNGCHWGIGIHCDDSRKSFDAAIDAAMSAAPQSPPADRAAGGSVSNPQR